MKLQKERKNRRIEVLLVFVILLVTEMIMIMHGIFNVNIAIGLLAGTIAAFISKVLEWWEYGTDGKGTLKNK